jgi:hypothetical protein
MEPPKQTDFDLFLEQELPPAMKNFPVWWLAKFWHTSVQQVWKLIQSGAFGDTWDLRDQGSSRAAYRIPRPNVVKFMRDRKDLQNVADANPSPAPRPRKEAKR